MGAQLNEDRFGVLTLTLTVASVGANSGNEQTFSVKGLRLNDFVAVSKPTLHAGIGIGSVRVSAKDTLAIQFTNATASPVTPGSETYLLFFYRPENVAKSVNV